MGNETQPHVLVVDDYSEIAKKIDHVIEQSRLPDLVCFRRSEGLAAFNGALSVGAPFCSVVTDFRMADRNGLAVAAAAKKESPPLRTSHRHQQRHVDDRGSVATVIRPVRESAPFCRC